LFSNDLPPDCSGCPIKPGATITKEPTRPLTAPGTFRQSLLHPFVRPTSYSTSDEYTLWHALRGRVLVEPPSWLGLTPADFAFTDFQWHQRVRRFDKHFDLSRPIGRPQFGVWIPKWSGGKRIQYTDAVYMYGEGQMPTKPVVLTAMVKDEAYANAKKIPRVIQFPPRQFAFVQALAGSAFDSAMARLKSACKVGISPLVVACGYSGNELADAVNIALGLAEKSNALFAPDDEAYMNPFDHRKVQIERNRLKRLSKRARRRAVLLRLKTEVDYQASFKGEFRPASYYTTNGVDVLDADVEKMDTSVRSEAHEANLAHYAALGLEEDIIQALREMGRCKGKAFFKSGVIFYEALHGMASGRADTTYGNTRLCLAVWLQVLERISAATGLPLMSLGITIFQSGDDTLIISPKCFSHFFRQFYPTDCLLNIKWGAETSMARTTFLGCHFIPSSLGWAPTWLVGRALYKAGRHTDLRVDSLAHDAEWFSSMVYATNHNPYFARAIKNLSKTLAISKESVHRPYKLNFTVMLEPDPQAASYVSEYYDGQLLMEEMDLQYGDVMASHGLRYAFGKDVKLAGVITC